jgi:molybdenum cofactor cytidylyltransferase
MLWMENQVSVMVVDGIILAAGLSSRTAPDCKLAYKLAGQTLLERSIGSMKPFCITVFVVTGAHAETVAGILHGREGIMLVHNPDFGAGMYGSVKSGLRCTCADGVFLLPGDCPFVTPEVYAALLKVEGEIVLPTWQGCAGHPVLLRRSIIPELLHDDICENLRQFIAVRHPKRIAVNCPGILTDIDTVEAYRQALLQMSVTDEWR